MFRRQLFDLNAYTDRSRNGPCFVCELIGGNLEYRQHIIYEDETASVFLSQYPALYGYTLVAPKEHREQVTSDFTIDEYLRLQRLIYRVAEALKQVVPTERIYLLSLGSQQGHRHVHWHIAPLPPGVPYEQQQMAALQLRRGLLEIADEEMAALAKRIYQAMQIEKAGPEG